MATATPTRPSAGERRRLADQARRDANGTATAATTRRTQAERDASGNDAAARLRAERDLPALRAAAADAQQQVEAAVKAFADVDREWRDEQFAHYRPLIAAKIRAVVAAVEAIERGPLAELHQAIAEAAVDGASASQFPTDAATFPLVFGGTPQSIFGVASGPSYVHGCIERLKRSGWLENTK